MKPEDKAIGLVQSVRYAFCARNQQFIKSNEMQHFIFSALFDEFIYFFRIVGNKDNWKADTLTLFAKKDFRGKTTEKLDDSNHADYLNFHSK